MPHSGDCSGVAGGRLPHGGSLIDSVLIPMGWDENNTGSSF